MVFITGLLGPIIQYKPRKKYEVTTLPSYDDPIKSRWKCWKTLIFLHRNSFVLFCWFYFISRDSHSTTFSLVDTFEKQNMEHFFKMEKLPWYGFASMI